MAVAVAVAGATAIVPLAQAAKITPIKGEVLVNSGAGYQRIEGTVELKPGDSAIANPSAQGSLVYADGCVVDVVPGMVAWVDQTSPCAATHRGTRDPATTLTTPKSFDPGWLLDGAASAKRRLQPAAP